MFAPHQILPPSSSSLTRAGRRNYFLSILLTLATHNCKLVSSPTLEHRGHVIFALLHCVLSSVSSTRANVKAWHTNRSQIPTISLVGICISLHSTLFYTSNVENDSYSFFKSLPKQLLKGKTSCSGGSNTVKNLHRVCSNSFLSAHT